MKLLIFSRIIIAVKSVLQNKKISLMYKKHQTDFFILIFIILYKLFIETVKFYISYFFFRAASLRPKNKIPKPETTIININGNV